MKCKISQLVDLDHVFSKCISLIEWPDKLANELPSEHLAVYLAMQSTAGDASANEADAFEDQPRVATLTAVGASWTARLEVLERVCGGARRGDGID